MIAEGCAPPVPFPAEAGAYGAAEVSHLLDELEADCPEVSRRLQHADCAEFPCLLFMEPPARADDGWPASACHRLGEWQWAARPFDPTGPVELMPTMPFALDGVLTTAFLAHPGKMDQRHYERALTRIRSYQAQWDEGDDDAQE